MQWSIYTDIHWNHSVLNIIGTVDSVSNQVSIPHYRDSFVHFSVYLGQY